MKTAEIREFTTKELEERIEAEKLTLNRLKINHTVSPLDNPMKIRQTRRNIARMLTELRNRQLSNTTK